MEAGVSADAWLLLAWILVGAAFVVTHLAVLRTAWKARGLALGVRLLALLPPLAPFVAWMAGRRATPVLWVALVLTYIGLRLVYSPQ